MGVNAIPFDELLTMLKSLEEKVTSLSRYRKKCKKRNLANRKNATHGKKRK